MNRGAFVPVIVGSVVFGLLMGLREQFQAIWARALVAGMAGAVFGLIVLFARRSRS